MQEVRALKNLLIKKGIITQDEFDKELMLVKKKDWAEKHNYRIHINSAEGIRYEVLKNGEWIKVEDPLTLKKRDRVRMFDVLTNSRLETERGDDEFILIKDFDGKSNHPYFE